MSDLIPSHVARALGFVIAVNEEDVFPAKGVVDAFANTEPPALGIDFYRLFSSLGRGHANESVATYLLATGLTIEHGGGLRATKSGVALKHAMDRRNATSPGQGVLEVVGRMEDPITYARVLTEIDKQDEALVVDPYLPASDLMTLIELPSLRRVLTRDIRAAGQAKEERKRHLALALGARPEVELRFLDDGIRELHDRLVIPRRGEALMIGTSLGGSQVTVMSHLSDDTTQVLRRHYDELWSAAERLQPLERINAVPDPTDAD